MIKASEARHLLNKLIEPTDKKEIKAQREYIEKEIKKAISLCSNHRIFSSIYPSNIKWLCNKGYFVEVSKKKCTVWW